MKRYSDKELIELYNADELESLNNSELERLKLLTQLGKTKINVEANVDIPDIAKESVNPHDNVEYSMPDKQRVNVSLGLNEEDVKNWMSDIDDYFSFAAGSDNGCDESTQLENNWYNHGAFAADVIHAAEVKGGLSRICRRGSYDLQAGNGDKVYIRQISARSDPNQVSACTCLSCTSNTFDKYTITINQLGDYANLCSWDEFKSGQVYRSSVIKSMFEHFSVYIDKKIFDALKSASPGYTETLNNTFDCNGSISGSCCTNGSDIYGRLLDLDARMRESGYNPDYLIVSPTVANYFKYLQTPGNSIANMSITMEGGVLTKVGHLNVIEYGGATACSTATATKFAWLVDSSRAIGQAFGKHPTLEFERDAKCNAWKIVLWAYWGVSTLDTNAIGVIQSPNS